MQSFAISRHPAPPVGSPPVATAPPTLSETRCTLPVGSPSMLTASPPFLRVVRLDNDQAGASALA